MFLAKIFDPVIEQLPYARAYSVLALFPAQNQRENARDHCRQRPAANDRYDGQVYKLWQQHNANGQPDWTPDKAVSLWDIYHTTDPAYAKPYVTPQGTRGLYQTVECMVWTDGQIWRSLTDNNAYTPESYPAAWEAVAV